MALDLSDPPLLALGPTSPLPGAFQVEGGDSFLPGLVGNLSELFMRLEVKKKKN